MNRRRQTEPEAPPPDLRDFTLWARIVDRERILNPLPQSRPWNGARVASPQSSILRPGGSSVAELDTAWQQRTIHLLIKPDILTCYRHFGHAASGFRWRSYRRSGTVAEGTDDSPETVMPSERSPKSESRTRDTTPLEEPESHLRVQPEERAKRRPRWPRPTARPPRRR